MEASDPTETPIWRWVAIAPFGIMSNKAVCNSYIEVDDLTVTPIWRWVAIAPFGIMSTKAVCNSYMEVSVHLTVRHYIHQGDMWLPYGGKWSSKYAAICPLTKKLEDGNCFPGVTSPWNIIILEDVRPDYRKFSSLKYARSLGLLRCALLKSYCLLSFIDISTHALLQCFAGSRAGMWLHQRQWGNLLCIYGNSLIISNQNKTRQSANHVNNFGMRSMSLLSAKISWWHHQMCRLSALPVLCAGNSLVTSEYPSQMPVTRSFDIFFDLRLNKRLNKQPRCRWFATPSRWLWRRYNVASIVAVDQHHVIGWNVRGDRCGKMQLTSPDCH